MRRASCGLVAILTLLAPSLMAMPCLADDVLLVVSNPPGGNSEVYLREGAAEPKNLSNHAAHDVFPAWSADGKRIAFASTRNGAYNIHIMNADGTELTAITNERKGSKFSCMCPTWSPDGERVAYTKQEGGNSTLITVQTDGRRERILTEWAWDPAWSPNGDKIVFTAHHDDMGWKLYSIEPDGGNLRMLCDMSSKAGYVYPAWSPDGKQIAFTTQVGENYEIHICNADGGNPKQLTKLGRMNTHATWSADGKAIYSWQDTDGANWRWMRTTIADGKSEPVKDLATTKYFHGYRIATRPQVKEGPAK